MWYRFRVCHCQVVCLYMLKRRAAEDRSGRKSLLCQPPPKKYGQKLQFHTIFLDAFLKIIFSKKNIPGSKCVTCSSFTDRKYPKNTQKYLKKGHTMVKNQNFEKLSKMCLDIDLKIIFSKYYVPMPKTMYMR